MAKTFDELDFLGATVSLLRWTHGSVGENRGGWRRFQPGYCDTHHRCFSIHVEYRVLRQVQRDGCAFEVISPHMDFPRVVRYRDGAFVALLLSSTPTGRCVPSGSGGQVECGVRHPFCGCRAARETRMATMAGRFVRGGWSHHSRA